MRGKAGTCAVGSCSEEPVEGSLFCGALGNGHLADKWANRLQLLSDGTYAVIAGPQPRAVEPEWRRRARLGLGRGLDLTGVVRS